MGKRPRHQDKHIEGLLLREAEARGWTVSRDFRYYRLTCPCGEHQTWVHLTPSNPNYLRDRLAFLRSRTCWSRGRT